ncbi:hypothetical protein H0H92_003239 [Tricholoma furcatifolium]|nr:hypothetical protein H0H92_003239 [Tricholoma furcatifolium]
MSKRKVEDAGQSPQKKRTRLKLPTFRPIRNSTSHQRSTLLRTCRDGHLGQRKKDKEVAKSTDDVDLIPDDGFYAPEESNSILNATDSAVSDCGNRGSDTKAKRKRNNTIAGKLKEWLNFRDSSLREVI